MCGLPMIQQQSTEHNDVTQRLIRKQRPASIVWFRVRAYSIKAKSNAFKNEKIFKVLKVESLGRKAITSCKNPFRKTIL